MEKTGKYMNLTTDFAFKHIFGPDANPAYILSFLNALLEGEKEIVKVTFVDKEHVGDSADDRALIYDLHCVTSTDEKIIIEMQNRYQTHFRDRALVYVSADLYHQAKRGDWDYRINPVYGIFMMNFDWKEFEGDPMREDVYLTTKTTGKVFSDKLRMIFLKIPLMEKRSEECETILDMWMYLFKNSEKMTKMPRNFLKCKTFEDLERTASLATLTKEEQMAYDHSLKVLRDNYAIADHERRQGRAEGRAEGRIEERNEIVMTMLAKGCDVDFISNMLNIPKEEILNISNRI